MSFVIHNVGDIVKVPQNVELLSSSKKRWLRLEQPEYGFIVDMQENKWPVVYKLFLRGNLWDAYEQDFYSMER